MKQLPITIIILTDRSDQRFFDALASAQIAQDVLIIDNNSGNNWNELQKEYQFRITTHDAPLENFAEVRNTAMEKADFDWVLFLDSDEKLSKNSFNQIKGILISDLYDGVTITRQDVFLSKKLRFGEAGTMPLMRMFKKDLTRFNRAIHEVAKVNGKVGSSEITIYHYAHDSISNFIKDVNWYAQRVAYQRALDPIEQLWQLIIYPPAKFLLNYIVKLGFLDGWRGLVYAIIMSMHSFSVRVFVYEQQKKHSETA